MVLVAETTMVYGFFRSYGKLNENFRICWRMKLWRFIRESVFCSWNQNSHYLNFDGLLFRCLSQWAEWKIWLFLWDVLFVLLLMMSRILGRTVARNVFHYLYDYISACFIIIYDSEKTDRRIKLENYAAFLLFTKHILCKVLKIQKIV